MCPERTADIELRLLVEGIYLKYSYDFRDYSGASLKRRVLQALSRFECESISHLQARVLHDPQLFSELLQFLTIPVSEMFRDPTYYQALREHVIPVLKTYPSLKVWIAGCSTGEEVFSMAILLKEEGLLDRTLIYATDINPRSLEKARRGVFPLEHVRKYTESYQQSGGVRAFSDYYTAAYEGALFDKNLIANVTFADHSLATDSVFSETHFISCRNVLIYFNKRLQDRAFGLFYESLCHRGFLGLGSKESLDFSSYADHFEPVVKKERVFRRL
ncbi:chemotaxis protein methyltransferase CheR [Pseudomonas duriflava]|uniref:Chemotaxis protein methyltransferase CheR n=1 Tax=Pseudomonas duriflava TaxID=459528 RepID=A0A562QJ79_9PSED|nr:protein-glutamate O-methyltransferase CheR [Pseudomonas duriflava]TWI56794.1 chemotaxis protein methyltransferase CheR [Pseudomonas duriflava]